MTFNDILKNTDASAEAKLTDLANLVKGIRKEYGNSDVEVEVPYVNTPDGMVELKYLDAESKVVLAGRQVKAATMEAVEECACNPACVFDREVERLVATDPIMCSLLASTGSKYI